ncbi:hypothetical protein HK098_008183, partial [Nowakowskiella sp. JEL0407]
LQMLTGHIDFSFACAWSPSGHLLATGNQDLTTRIYDMRNPSKTLYVLPGKMGAIRSLRFSDDGNFLAMAEPADFVHIFDVTVGTADGYKSQVVDFFGEVGGVGFSEGGENFFIANS